MGTNTVMLGYQLRDGVTKEDIVATFPDILSRVMDDVTVVYPRDGIKTPGSDFVVATGSKFNGRCVATVHYHSNGLLTVDVQHESSQEKELVPPNEPYTYNYMWQLDQKVLQRLGELCLGSVSLSVPIRRPCRLPHNYIVLGNLRLAETDFTHALCDVTSPFQNIKILQSTQFGRALLLDNEMMLSEGDHKIYTRMLLGLDRGNDFGGTSVLILGGGDGDVLNTLTSLQDPPRHVTMAEIDEEVMKACAKYMPSVCGRVFDAYKTDKYTIEVKDCVQVLKERAERGERFDYIINDLTEFPVNKEIYGFQYDFNTNNILMELSCRCLNKGGKYLARGNAMGASDYLDRTEKEMSELGLVFSRYDTYIPSFMEMYSCYDATKP